MVYRVSTARPPHLLCNSNFGVDLTHRHEIKPQQSHLQQSCPQSLNSVHGAELPLSELTSRYQSRLHAIRADFTLSELLFAPSGALPYEMRIVVVLGLQPPAPHTQIASAIPAIPVTLCSQAYWFTNEMLAEASYGSGLPPI
jgi:hypothetical protein